MQSKIVQWDINKQRVILRADLNVPIAHHTIESTFRLEALKPTLDLLLEKGAIPIIITHIGHPKKYDPQLSTQILIPWFEQQQYTIHFAPDLSTAQQYSNGIILLENIRFFKEEYTQDDIFAHQLAQLGTFYVNDAFGSLHRNDTSITRVPQLFSPDKRSIGLLVQKELQILTPIRIGPKKPFVLILGGGKIETKLPLIEHFLTKADTIIVLPALSFPFDSAYNKSIGKSAAEVVDVELCREMVKAGNTNIILPEDYVVASHSIEGPLHIRTSGNIQDDEIGISIGPRTLSLVTPIIQTAQTIFFNGVPGFSDLPETMINARKLLEIITQTNATTLLSGGDSIAAADKYNLLHQFTHVSTGGGSTLTYISGQELLGLQYLQ